MYINQLDCVGHSTHGVSLFTVVSGVIFSKYMHTNMGP